MTYYTVVLALEQTLKCLSIKADTMGRYLNAADELSIPHKIISLSLDFMKKIPLHRGNHQRIKKKGRYTKQKEQLTEDMILHIINKVNDKDNDNGIYHAMTHWLIMGIQTGCRKSKWSQDKTKLNKIKYLHKTSMFQSLHSR